MMNPYFATEIIKTNDLVEERFASASLSDVTGFFQYLNLIRKMERRSCSQKGDWLRGCVELMHKNWATLKYILERDKEQEPIGIILSFISYVSHLDSSRGIEAGNLVGQSYIISRLNEINSLSELRYAIFSIEHVYPELKDLTLKEFAKFIENEISINGVFSVAYFFGCLFKDSNLLENDKETIVQILNLVDIDIIKTMKQSSIYPFCLFAELGI